MILADLPVPVPRSGPRSDRGCLVLLLVFALVRC
jgi:hypothetical protein